MAAPIASWNSQRDVWETDQGDLISGHLVVFSETFPTSGMTRSGTAYALPTSEPATDDSGCSYLPTPTSSDTNGVGTHGTGGLDLRTAVAKL